MTATTRNAVGTAGIMLVLFAALTIIGDVPVWAWAIVAVCLAVSVSVAVLERRNRAGHETRTRRA